MFAGDSQMLHNKHHFIISVIVINLFYCIQKIQTLNGCLKYWRFCNVVVVIV